MGFLPYSDVPLADALAAQGWWLSNSVFPAELITSLSQEATQLAESSQLVKAAVGRGIDKQHLDSVRGDSIKWIDADTGVHNAFLELCNGLQQQLNQTLFLGLRSCEAHFAYYPAGGFYRQHIDSLRGQRNRVVSMVVYLNSDWGEVDGGELELFDQHSQSIGLVKPIAGNVLLFLSEELPHAVLETRKDRYSIAAWFRCN